MIATLLALLAVMNSALPSSVSYACNGTQVAYAVTYPYQDQAYLVATSTTTGGAVTTLVIVTDYTLNVTSSSTSAVLTLTAGSKCPNLSTLKIARKTPKTQPQVFNQQVLLTPPIYERALDRATMISQEGVSVTAPLVGNGTDTNVSMPQASGSVNGFLSSVDWTAFNTAAGYFSSGVLTGAHGGLGAVQPTCSGSQVVTCNGSVCSCVNQSTAAATNTNTSLTGDGSIGSPLGLSLNHANTWTATQTFAPTATNATAVVATGAPTNGSGLQATGNGGSPAIKFGDSTTGDDISLFARTSDPANADNGGLWYRSDTGQLRTKLGGVAATISTGNANGWPTRKTATDANTYLYWSLDQGALPLTNGIVAQGSSGDFDTNGNVGFTFSVPGMFSTSVFSPFTGARVGAQASASTALSPASPISVWFWLKSGGGAANACNAIDGVFKAYRAPGTWAAPFASVIVNINGTCSVTGQVTTGTNGSGTAHSVTGVTFIRLGAWNLIWMTYDGANVSVGLNNYPPTTGGVTGAIDYNSNAGRWGLGVDESNATSWSGQIDEVHVDTVARSTSYFQTVWQTATQEGGN